MSTITIQDVKFHDFDSHSTSSSPYVAGVKQGLSMHNVLQNF